MKLAPFLTNTLLGVVLAVSPVSALDLTGTWDGSWSCAGFDGAKYSTKGETSVLAISDLGGGVARASIDGYYFYNVAVVPDAKNPAEHGVAALNECGTDDVPLVGTEAEMMRAKLTIKSGGSAATFVAASIFEDGFGSVGTCTYGYKRRDTADPLVPPCP